jgi:hypothetical protein
MQCATVTPPLTEKADVVAARRVLAHVDGAGLALKTARPRYQGDRVLLRAAHHLHIGMPTWYTQQTDGLSFS